MITVGCNGKTTDSDHQMSNSLRSKCGKCSRQTGLCFCPQNSVLVLTLF